MTIEQKILDMSFPAAESLINDQYRFVVLTSTGTVRRPDTASELALGVLQNAPAINEAAVVRIFGVSKVVANGVIAIGTFVGPEYVSAADAGKCQDDSALPAFARGIVIDDSAAEDDLCSVLISPLHAPASAIAVGDITIASGKMIMGIAGGAGSAVTPAGDVTIDSATGATAIGSNKVLTAMISSSQITATKIGAGAVLAAHISSSQIATAMHASTCLSDTLSDITSSVASHVTSSAH
jgi:hypothetical protein